MSNNEANDFGKGKNIVCSDNGSCDDDFDLSSEDEEEALRIMEYQSKKSKRTKFIKHYAKDRINLESENYKINGIIKEEDNESSSESIQPISLVKCNQKSKKILSLLDYKLKNIARKEKEELRKRNIYKTNDIKDNEINIKNTILKNLEEAVNEFEKEQFPNNQTKKNKKEKNYKLVKSNTADIFKNNIQKEKEKKNKYKKYKNSPDDKENQRSNLSYKLSDSSPNNKINYKKIINNNIFKNFKIIHQKVKNCKGIKKNLNHSKDSINLMKKLEKINIRNISLNRNNNIRKYYMETDYKNKSLVIENNISKLLKGEINRKDSNYKLIKKNNNNKVKNKRCRKKDENNIKTNYKCIKRYSDYIISTKLSNISQRSTLYKTEDSIKIIKQNKKQKKNIRIFENEKESANTLFNGKKILHPKEVKLNKIINKTKILDKNNYN
jgi:hypothetical protein